MKIQTDEYSSIKNDKSEEVGGQKLIILQYNPNLTWGEIFYSIHLQPKLQTVESRYMRTACLLFTKQCVF